MTALPQIPLLDLADAGPLAFAEQRLDQAAGLIAAGRRQYSGWLIDGLDCLSRRWARRGRSPYLAELERLAAQGLPRGVWFMNHSYEWGCTTRAAADPGGEGVRLLRTLDWPFHGLGRHTSVVRQQTPAGPYYNITWPGFLGVITAMAPARFAAAINQAPLRRHGPRGLPYPWPLDWVISRFKTFRGDRIAPAHLLRQVMETCPTFAEARRALCDAPLALPVFFTLAGTKAGEACVIERLEDEAFVHEAPAAVANHWLSPHLTGRPRGRASAARLAMMQNHRIDSGDVFDWLAPPILNPDTRLAVVANAARGHLQVQGYEQDGPATALFDLAVAEAA